MGVRARVARKILRLRLVGEKGGLLGVARYGGRTGLGTGRRWGVEMDGYKGVRT